jgi:hypothetical protein
MAGNDERRNARRIHLAQPVEASLSHYPVAVMDLSTSGARIQHHSPLTFMPGKQFVLEFACEGEWFRLTCTVARCRLEARRASSQQQTVYTSGVRFVDMDEASIERLWGLIAFLAVGVLEQEGIAEIPYEFEILSH